jgi:hypothetical protein
LSKWWLLPVGIVTASAIVTLGIVTIGPLFVTYHSAAEVVPQVASERETAIEEHHDEAAERSEAQTSIEPAHLDCSAAPSNDYPCIQQRYQDLVRNLGVEAAFAELQGEMATNNFISSHCHQISHVIGRVAADIYGDIPNTYSHGNSFCGSGYYHGALETIVAKIGPDRIFEEIDSLCADLGEHPEHSLFHYNCAHGLGHGFMGIQENDIFDSLETCDALSDSWERERCYGGVFMENVITKDEREHPSKYLKAASPLYPCDAIESRYKNECYQRQTSYALQTQGNDFVRVFDLCRRVEDGFSSPCYQGLGWDASVQSLKQTDNNAAINQSTKDLCMLGGEYEARFNCIVGAVEYFVRHYYSDAQPKVFCETLTAGLRAVCLQEVEEYYPSLESPLERRT